MAHSSNQKKTETAITPFLNVRRGAEAIDFYTRAFGAATLNRINGEDGSVVAQLAVDSARFWLADEALAYQNPSPEALGGTTFRIALIVDDPHAVFDRAIAAGATSVCPVRDEEYGWRIGRIVDPFGHHWEIGKPLSEN